MLSVDLPTYGKLSIDLVGCGGTGSQILSGLIHLDTALQARQHPGLQVTLWDGDVVSAANLGRTTFYPGDVGSNKAMVLMHRVSLFHGKEWVAKPQHFPGSSYFQPGKIVISCVDTIAARKSVHETLHKYSTEIYWLDTGNQQYDGQVILGTNSPTLPHVFDLFPEVLQDDYVESDAPSCSLNDALTKQDLFINGHIAHWALHLLWRMLKDGGIDHHAYFINLLTGHVVPKGIPEKVEEK